MTEGQFKTELGKAQTFARLESDPDKAAYWRGYQRGIRRNWHGDRFGTAEEHRRFIEAAESEDAERAALGRGYRDGLAYGKEA
jgi:hypothetical protein